MPASNHQSSGQLLKRTLPSDVAPENAMQSKRERVKRRRTSKGKDEVSESFQSASVSDLSKISNDVDTTTTTNEGALREIDEKVAPQSESWSLLRSITGQFNDIDPIITFDEQYIFLGLETAVHVYSIATSRLFRVLEIGPRNSIIGFHLSPLNQERLFVFTLSGSVSEWDWLSSKQVAHWNMHHQLISADIVYGQTVSDTKDSSVTLFSLQERKDGKKELVVTNLDNEKAQSTTVLETNTKIDNFKVAGNGQAVIAYGGAHIFFGSVSSSQSAELLQYTWREVKLPFVITCVDVKQGEPLNQPRAHLPVGKKALEFDLSLGGADGSILIYHDPLGFLGIGGNSSEKKNLAPRRLHWHRDPVRAVRWSKDGNYVISGGHESVMVLWQLDTGRKQFLPHLSSPICSIVVSDSGKSYAVKLADNRVVVLSARELQPLATITGLQLCVKAAKSARQSMPKVSSSRAVTAVLHPQHADQLLITVPASHQVAQDGSTLTNSPVLQTYDIRSNSHISRQALARTNATTLNISPDGAQILAPDVKYLEVSQDGKWMATIDSWTPYLQDVEALGLESNGGVPSEFEEIHLKFWRWNESSSLWELLTRIDGPHLSNQGSNPVLDLASRPHSHEFATIGSDALVRFWRPIIKQRGGLKADNIDQPLETWKCRNTIDLRAYAEVHDSSLLSSASMCFSQDGSVLAVCMQSASANPGIAILIDVQSCTVRYSKIGAYSGNICASAFLGYHLVIATMQSVFIWDIVNDVVRTTETWRADTLGDDSTCLLAVNPKTETFAIASRNLPKKTASKKSRKSRHILQVYNIHSISLVSQFTLKKEPVALLSNSHSAEYVVVDTAANVQRLGRMSKGPQVSHTDDMPKFPESGLIGLFGRQSHSSAPAIASSDTRSLESGGLASVFGDIPPFVLPPSRIIFRDLVKALSI